MTLDLSDLKIRSATADDLDDLLSLYQDLNPEDLPASRERQNNAFQGMLNQPGLMVLLVFREEQAVASCVLAVIPNLTRGCSPYALIENVVTHREFRGLGIGACLMEAACNKAWEQGCFKVMLMSGKTNQNAHRFYERVGFSRSKVGFEKRLKDVPVRQAD